MSSNEKTRTAPTAARRARTTAGVCGVALVAGAVALGVVTPASADVATDGVPFAQLQKQVDQLTVALQKETAARGADVTALQAALAAERTARAAGDTVLTTALGEERTARAAGDTALTTALGEEQRLRAAGDATLTTALADETSARKTADQRLEGLITGLEGLIAALEGQTFEVRFVFADVTVPYWDNLVHVTRCAAGEYAISGGFKPDDDESTLSRSVLGSAPYKDGWRVDLHNGDVGDWSGTAYALCVQA